MAVAVRHFFREHVGELELVIEGPSLDHLFAEAGRALAAIMAGETMPAQSAIHREQRPEREKPGSPEAAFHDEANGLESITVHAIDREALLVEWLNELVFLSETRHAVYPDPKIDSIGANELSARARALPIEALKTAVKGASLHGLRIEDVPGGYRATVVLDV